MYIVRVWVLSKRGNAVSYEELRCKSYDEAWAKQIQLMNQGYPCDVCRPD